MSLTLQTGPAANAVSAADVYAHLRVPTSGSPAVPTDADHIDTLIAAATGHLDGRDGWLGRCLVTQTWDYSLDGFPAEDRPIRLPLAPVQSITSISYTDTAGASQTFASSKWSLSADKDWRPRIDLGYGEAWPSTRDVPDAVTVRFVAGYGDADTDVPPAIRSALKILIGDLYAQRETVVVGTIVGQLPQVVEALLAPYRRVGWGGPRP